MSTCLATADVVCSQKRLGDQAIQAEALSEQIAALHQCKTSLGEQLESLMLTNEKLARDLEVRQ